MDLICGQDAAVAAWAAARIPHMGSPGPCAAIGVASQGRLVAACVYHNYLPEYGVIEISFAADSPRWAQRGVIRALLHYPFVQLGCRRVSVVVPVDGERTLKLAKGLGFVQEGTVREFFGPKRHACVLGMLRREYDRLFVKGKRRG